MGVSRKSQVPTQASWCELAADTAEVHQAVQDLARSVGAPLTGFVPASGLIRCRMGDLVRDISLPGCTYQCAGDGGESPTCAGEAIALDHTFVASPILYAAFSEHFETPAARQPSPLEERRPCCHSHTHIAPHASPVRGMRAAERVLGFSRKRISMVIQGLPRDSLPTKVGTTFWWPDEVACRDWWAAVHQTSPVRKPSKRAPKSSRMKARVNDDKAAIGTMAERLKAIV